MILKVSPLEGTEMVNVRVRVRDRVLGVKG
jgi:hypothetical protein